MSRMFRPVVILLMLVPLVGFLAATSRAAVGATQMVICGSDGARTIWLDADGNPTEAPVECDDCLASLSFELGAAPDAFMVRPLAVRPIAALPSQPGNRHIAVHRLAPKPRGPPQAILDGVPS